MLIDWFTVGAQVLNFVILVWLMKRFLYQPILHAIDAREKRIADQLADAEARKAEARKERDEFERKNGEFDQQRAERLKKVTMEADSEKKRLLDEAREAADAMTAKRLETLHQEAQTLKQALTRRTQDEVFAITRKVLSDLADTDLEKRATAVFLQNMQAMEDDARSDLAQALTSSDEPAVIRSAFELPKTQRAKLQTAINQTFSAEIALRYETTPDLVTGIELTAGGNKIAWSISDYLSSLENGVEELLKAKTNPGAL
jgi:F-type H+-transporting ATPase subunit b